MEEKYKEWTIKYEEASETFVATDPTENTLKSQKLKELKKKIDKFSFKRIAVLYKSYHKDDLMKGEVTSIADRGSDHWKPDVWVTYVDKDGDKSRTKTSIDHLYKQTDNNMKIHKEIILLTEDKEKLDEKIDELKNKLERITRKDLGLEEQN